MQEFLLLQMFYFSSTVVSSLAGWRVGGSMECSHVVPSALAVSNNPPGGYIYVIQVVVRKSLHHNQPLNIK